MSKPVAEVFLYIRCTDEARYDRMNAAVQAALDTCGDEDEAYVSHQVWLNEDPNTKVKTTAFLAEAIQARDAALLELAVDAVHNAPHLAPLEWYERAIREAWAQALDGHAEGEQP